MQRHYVMFSAEINPTTIENLMGLTGQLLGNGATSIYLMFSTPGGVVMSGITLYNFLKALPVELIIHNAGNVDSIGNAIFLAGKRRIACPHSTFMFHGVGFESPAGARLEEKSVRERLNSILADQRRIGEIVREHTTLNASKIRGLFKEQRTKDAAWARGVGVVHDVADIAIPPGAPVHALVFRR